MLGRDRNAGMSPLQQGPMLDPLIAPRREPSTICLQFLRLVVLSSVLFFAVRFYASEVRLYSTTTSSSSSSSRQADSLIDQFLAGISNTTISEHLRELTREPHVAGTPENFATARYVHEVFEKAGLSARYSDFDVLLTSPVHRKLTLLLPDGQKKELSLKEEAVPGDPFSNSSKVIPTFFAYSKSGTVTGEAVYANYGRVEDFEFLKARGINVTGAVIIARYGKIFRGDIVANAAEAGAIGALVYSDPFDYAASGSKGYYPSSKWLPPSGVQRGSVFGTAGDPVTPGWPSVQGGERLEMSEDMLSSIPALPISAVDALPILQALGGDDAPSQWQGALKVGNSYKLGRGPALLELSYEGNESVKTIRNVIAVIDGREEPDRYVLLGNHRDAWTFGAADPNSGTACLLELASGFKTLLSQGWRPRRTIVLCSWDAEEYGLIGSTEWVEKNLQLLLPGAVAYINVDRAVGGPLFDASSTPQLDNVLREVTKLVEDPNSEYGTVYEAWSALNQNSTPYIGRLGSGRSDFAHFLHHAGVPSYDIRYQKGFPVYHSLYDDYLWMSKYGDPLFKRHVAVTGIWGVLAIRLADDEVLPFDYLPYCDELEAAVKSLQSDIAASAIAASHNITLEPLTASISKFRAASRYIKATSQTSASSINARLLIAERSFLEAGRPWSNHLIYGVSKHNRYGSRLFPAVGDAIGAVAPDPKAVQHEIWKVARAVTNAATVLRGELL